MELPYDERRMAEDIYEELGEHAFDKSYVASIIERDYLDSILRDVVNEVMAEIEYIDENYA